MKHLNRNIRGSLVLFGVALGVIGTAGAASAQEAPPAADGSTHASVADDGGTVESSSAQDDEAEVGQPLLLERPAPRRNPSSELGSDPAPSAAPAAPAPAPVPAASLAPNGGTTLTATAPAAASVAPTKVATRRQTEVKGIQIQRSATRSTETASLARTGVATQGLVALAAAFFVLGSVLIRFSRPRRTF